MLTWLTGTGLADRDRSCCYTCGYARASAARLARAMAADRDRSRTPRRAAPQVPKPGRVLCLGLPRGPAILVKVIGPAPTERLQDAWLVFHNPNYIPTTPPSATAARPPTPPRAPPPNPTPPPPPAVPRRSPSPATPPLQQARTVPQPPPPPAWPGHPVARAMRDVNFPSCTCASLADCRQVCIRSAVKASRWRL